MNEPPQLIVFSPKNVVDDTNATAVADKNTTQQQHLPHSQHNHRNHNLQRRDSSHDPSDTKQHRHKRTSSKKDSRRSSKKTGSKMSRDSSDKRKSSIPPTRSRAETLKVPKKSARPSIEYKPSQQKQYSSQHFLELPQFDTQSRQPAKMEQSSNSRKTEKSSDKSDRSSQHSSKKGMPSMDLSQQKRLSEMVVANLNGSNINGTEKTSNPYDEFTLGDLKVLEETIQNNRNELEKELKVISEKKKFKKQITLQPQIARKWEKVKNQLLAFTVMKKIFTDIKKYGTSMQALNISNQVIEKCRDLLEKRQVDSIKKQRLIYPNTTFDIVWMTIVFCLYCFTAVYSPFKIFFLGASYDSTVMYVIDKIVELLFFLDIVVKSNTAMLDGDGNLIEDRRIIFKRYLKRAFFLDVCQVLPFEILVPIWPSLDDQVIRPKDYSEVIRIIRLPLLLSAITIDQKIFEYFKLQSTFQRLIRFSTAVLFSVHIVGCLWVFIAAVQAEETQTWIKLIMIDQNDSVLVYLFAVYWCLQTLATVGFGDVHASNEAEVIFSLFWMVIGVGFYSFAIGQLSKMFTDSESRAQKLKNSIYIMDEFCEQAGLARHVKDRIHKALQYSTNKVILTSSEKEDFFDSIPMKLKTSLAEGMFKGTITAVPFLKNKDSIFLAHLLPMLQPLKLNKGDFVYRKDQFPNLMYFLIEGRIDLLAGPHEMTFKSFLGGSYFGEIEIFNQCLRQFNVRCQVNCEFLTLDREYLSDLMEKFPNIEEEMLDMAQQRQELIDISLKKLSIFLDLKEADPFWRPTNLPTFAEIINQRRKSQSLFSPSEHGDAPSDHNVFKHAKPQQPQLLSPTNLAQSSSSQLLLPISHNNSAMQKFKSTNDLSSQNLSMNLLNNMSDSVQQQHNNALPAITPSMSPIFSSAAAPQQLNHEQESSNTNLQKSISIFKITRTESIQPLGLAANATMSASSTTMTANGSGKLDSLHNIKESPPVNPVTPSNNQVVLNVFDENKQPKLIEVYTEEIQQQRQSVSSQLSSPQINSMSLSIPVDDTQIGRIKQKYGVSSLDRIEERNSHADNQSNLNTNSEFQTSMRECAAPLEKYIKSMNSMPDQRTSNKNIFQKQEILPTNQLSVENAPPKRMIQSANHSKSRENISSKESSMQASSQKQNQQQRPVSGGQVYSFQSQTSNNQSDDLSFPSLQQYQNISNHTTAEKLLPSSSQQDKQSEGSLLNYHTLTTSSHLLDPKGITEKPAATNGSDLRRQKSSSDENIVKSFKRQNLLRNNKRAKEQEPALKGALSSREVPRIQIEEIRHSLQDIVMLDSSPENTPVNKSALVTQRRASRLNGNSTIIEVKRQLEYKRAEKHDENQLSLQPDDTSKSDAKLARKPRKSAVEFASDGARFTFQAKSMVQIEGRAEKMASSQQLLPHNQSQISLGSEVSIVIHRSQTAIEPERLDFRLGQSSPLADGMNDKYQRQMTTQNAGVGKDTVSLKRKPKRKDISKQEMHTDEAQQKSSLKSIHTLKKVVSLNSAAGGTSARRVDIIEGDDHNDENEYSDEEDDGSEEFGQGNVEDLEDNESILRALKEQHRALKKRIAYHSKISRDSKKKIPGSTSLADFDEFDDLPEARASHSIILESNNNHHNNYDIDNNEYKNNNNNGSSHSSSSQKKVSNNSSNSSDYIRTKSIGSSKNSQRKLKQESSSAIANMRTRGDSQNESPLHTHHTLTKQHNQNHQHSRIQQIQASEQEEKAGVNTPTTTTTTPTITLHPPIVNILRSPPLASKLLATDITPIHLSPSGFTNRVDHVLEQRVNEVKPTHHHLHSHHQLHHTNSAPQHEEEITAQQSHNPSQHGLARHNTEFPLHAPP